MDPNLRRETILEHYQHPVHRGLVEDDTYYLENTSNESCIDNLDVMVKFSDGKISDIRFDGEACAMSTSATSMMISLLLGKSVLDAKKILLQYENMIDEKAYQEDLLGELVVYDEVYLQPNRKKCALLPFVSLMKIIARYEEDQNKK